MFIPVSKHTWNGKIDCILCTSIWSHFVLFTATVYLYFVQNKALKLYSENLGLPLNKRRNYMLHSGLTAGRRVGSIHGKERTLTMLLNVWGFGFHGGMMSVS